MPKESNLEFKVGLFVFIALAVLTVFVFSISDTSFLEKGKTMDVVFEFANGLKKNAPVRLAGVEEGKVKDIILFFDRKDSKTKAQITIKIKQETQIPIDSVFTINQLGLLGEKYVEIVPGVNTEQFMKAGETFRGKDPVPQNMISERVMSVTKKVEDTFGGISVIISDEDNQKSISETLRNLSDVTMNLNDILETVKKGEGNLGRFLYEDGIYDDLNELTSDLKENPWKLLYRPKAVK